MYSNYTNTRSTGYYVSHHQGDIYMDGNDARLTVSSFQYQMEQELPIISMRFQSEDSVIQDFSSFEINSLRASIKAAESSICSKTVERNSHSDGTMLVDFPKTIKKQAANRVTNSSKCLATQFRKQFRTFQLNNTQGFIRSTHNHLNKKPSKISIDDIAKLKFQLAKAKSQMDASSHYNHKLKEWKKQLQKKLVSKMCLNKKLLQCIDKLSIDTEQSSNYCLRVNCEIEQVNQITKVTKQQIETINLTLDAHNKMVQS